MCRACEIRCVHQEGVREEFMGALQRAETYKPDIKTKYVSATLLSPASAVLSIS